jgi:hypothetical protein
VTDQPDPESGTDAAIETHQPDPTEVHRAKQRRLLFAIELTLFALVLVFTSGGSLQGAGFVVAIFGLLIALSGL